MCCRSSTFQDTIVETVEEFLKSYQPPMSSTGSGAMAKMISTNFWDREAECQLLLLEGKNSTAVGASCTYHCHVCSAQHSA